MDIKLAFFSAFDSRTESCLYLYLHKNSESSSSLSATYSIVKMKWNLWNMAHAKPILTSNLLCVSFCIVEDGQLELYIPSSFAASFPDVI